ncbi:flagellin N-terminal helical domain-containing protein [Robertmurraya andreesenii]|uniref:Flagellin n=1 Tax=Anoxybacillus andreesenii TaxID=1325932 RepID=A0ABT9V7L9_9BACL|nr:flagellin [Robertmurraya andreesenii]MDQ0156927.1 flagellin [Robertmurraya andreesenii]
MKINHNIQALNAYRNLYQNQFNTSKNLERLSSGLRINRAADDAAGLAISEKMRSQIRGLKQAERNSLDGVSLMQVAEGAMTEVHSMLQRMRELAVQAANDTNTTEDRTAIQKEIDQLRLEIDSIASKTEFNTRKLLDGSSAADTQFRENQIGGTNIKSVPVVTEPSMKTGLYQIGVESTPEIVYALNQPGAGVSTADVLKIGNAQISINGAGINNINATNLENAQPGQYKLEYTSTSSTIKSTTTAGDISTATIASTGTDDLAPGEYTIKITGYDNSTTPATANITLLKPDGTNFSTPLTAQDLSALPITVTNGNEKIELSSLSLTGNGTIKIKVESDAGTFEIKDSSNNVVASKSVSYTDNKLKEEQIGDFKVSLSPSQLMNGTTTFDVKESALALGEYSIVVSDYQIDSNGRPNATIEIFNPDGFSIGKLASLIGDANGSIQTIGTEPGKTIQIDTRKITQAGTAKVQVEAKVEISVSMVDDKNTTNTSDDDVTAITFPKELKTMNGKVTHGGLELEFGANVKKGESKFDITNKALAFQIGANTNQNVMIDVPELSTVKLGIEEINVLDHKSANDAIFKLEKAINQISSTRSKLGATQNRLEHTINNLQVTHENLTSAESRIRDADMALEMTEFTKNNILNQSAQAMLAQANQLPQGVLQLLQG